MFKKIFQKLLFTVILSYLNTIHIHASDRLLDEKLNEPDQRVIVIHEVHYVSLTDTIVNVPAQTIMRDPDLHAESALGRNKPNPVPDKCSVKCLLCGPEIAGFDSCYPIYNGGKELKRPWCSWWMTGLGAAGLITGGVMGLNGAFPILAMVGGSTAFVMGALTLCIKLEVYDCLSEFIDDCAK